MMILTPKGSGKKKKKKTNSLNYKRIETLKNKTAKILTKW